MIRYAIRTLRRQPFRLAFTVAAIGLCVVLILFLLSIYEGVAVGSVAYVEHNRTDLWILQTGATNILRGSSFLTSSHGPVLCEVAGVWHASPVLFILSTITARSGASTVYLTGYDPESGHGGPPIIVRGRNVANRGEIVLDRSFARKAGISLGDTVRIRQSELTVVGVSDGTNMFVIQYGFVPLAEAQEIIGYPNLVTCYMVDLKPQSEVSQVQRAIREELPGLEVFSHEEFVANNTREMESGILPLLYTIALVGGVVLTTVLTLILSINILERRKDFALLKTLGAPGPYLPRFVLAQAGVLGLAGLVAGCTLVAPMAAMIEQLAPEVSTKTTAVHVVLVSLGVVVMSAASAAITARRLRRIYPLEAFQ